MLGALGLTTGIALMSTRQLHRDEFFAQTRPLARFFSDRKYGALKKAHFAQLQGTVLELSPAVGNFTAYPNKADISWHGFEHNKAACEVPRASQAALSSVLVLLCTETQG